MIHHSWNTDGVKLFCLKFKIWILVIGKFLEISWMIPIIARNLIGTIILCGFWDWLLYFSPLKSKFHKFGFQNANFCDIIFFKTEKSIKSIVCTLRDIKLCMMHPIPCLLHFLHLLLKYGYAMHGPWDGYHTNRIPTFWKTYLLGHSYSYGEHLIFISFIGWYIHGELCISQEPTWYLVYSQLTEALY